MNETKINIRRINDPLFSSVNLFLKGLIKKAEDSGNPKKIQLARERYGDLENKDLTIEDAVLSEGVLKSCFLSRKTGFMRGDGEIVKVPFKQVLDDFNVKYKQKETTNVLTEPTLYHVDGQFYIRVKFDTSLDELYALFNRLYFDKYELEIFPRIKDDQIGELTIESKNIDSTIIPIHTHRLPIDAVFKNPLFSGFSF